MPVRPVKPDPWLVVGTNEIAERAGVESETVSRSWIYRGIKDDPFPMSEGRVSGREWWWWPDIVPWLGRRGITPTEPS